MFRVYHAVANWALLMLLTSAGVTGQTLRDPTMPMIVPSQTTVGTQSQVELNPSLTLTMTLFREGEWVAIIGGQPIREGATLGERQVVKITHDRVLLDSGEPLLLFGSPAILKTP